MKQIVYTMHFRGQASPSVEDAALLKTTGTGTSCTMETVVGPTGVETTLHPARGDLAFLESEVRLAGNEAFEGRGVLTFGDSGEHAEPGLPEHRQIKQALHQNDFRAVFHSLPAK